MTALLECVESVNSTPPDKPGVKRLGHAATVTPYKTLQQTLLPVVNGLKEPKIKDVE